MLFDALFECISKQSLSPTMRQGPITLIPKAKKNLLSLENWRPITLFCMDYKLLALVCTIHLNCGLITAGFCVKM